MSVARKGFLRASMRRIQMTGPHQQHVDHVSIPGGVASLVILPQGKKVFNAENVAPGTVVRIDWPTTIAAFDRVLYVKYPSSLYLMGQLSGPGMLDEEDGPVVMSAILTVMDTEVDLSKIPDLKIYVEGETK